MNDNRIVVDTRPSGGSGGGLAVSGPNAKTVAPRQQKWGHSALTAAKRRRITAEPDYPAWDDEFADDVGGCDDFYPDVDEENPFDSIDKLLDQREKETKQVNDDEEGPQHECGECGGPFEDEAMFSHCDDEFDQFSFRGSLAGREDETMSSWNEAGNGVFIDEFNQQMTGNVNEKPSDSFLRSALFADGEQNVQSTTRKRAAKQYSIIKSSTPRFTFQSALKPKVSTFQTPSNRQSLPQRNLFSVAATQKSGPMQRHSFRKSMDRTKTLRVSDARSMDCTPSFLAGKTRTKEGITQESPQDEALRPLTSTFASLRKSINSDGRQSTSRNIKSGYLIQRLRSLRNNDQRMAMRLRSGQLFMVGGAAARKRRRSGEYLDPKNSSLTELDVTVSSVTCLSECAFGEGKSLLVGYIHRFEGKAGCLPFGAIKLNLPCFAWIILSNDVMREQGLVNGTVKHLRFYDAVVIPPRIAMSGMRASESVHGELAMPTIACTGVCEKYPGETALPNVSFDRFQTTA